MGAVPDSYLNKAAMLRAVLLVSLCVASALSASPKWRRSVDESNRFMVHGSPRLVGGEPAQPNQFPYQVSFQYKFGGHFCGGMVYDENHVITAAHCCTNSASQVKIVAGDHRLNSNDGTEQERDVGGEAARELLRLLQRRLHAHAG